jgi:hypothetical protein
MRGKKRKEIEIGGADFPHMNIYAAEGPLMRIAFQHWEDGGAWLQLKGLISIAVCMAGGCVATWAMLQLPEGYIPNGWWAAGALFSTLIVVPIILAGIFKVNTGPPFVARREIQLDPVRDQFRVYRDGKLEITRRMWPKPELTIDEHPKAAIDRIKPRTTNKPRRYEKQHVLVGWFGARHAEKVVLMGRWEWPPEFSLAEVRKAVLFAHDFAAQAEAMVERGAAERKEKPGMKPPLD